MRVIYHKEKRFTLYIAWIIWILVLTKPGLNNDYLMLTISDIVLLSNIFKAILYIILYNNNNTKYNFM